MRAPSPLVRLRGSAMRNLEPFVGVWTFLEETNDALSPVASGEAVFHYGPGGHSLIFDEVVIPPDGSSYAHGILGWRPQRNRYACFVADSRLSGVQAFAGSWTRDRLILEAVESPLLARTYEWSDFSPESFVLRVSLPFGQVRWRTYRRKGGAAS